jgi:hypothetical protein
MGTVWPWVRSTATSATATAARKKGHVRRGVRARAASVTPADGKNAAPAAGEERNQKGRSAPTA